MSEPCIEWNEKLLLEWADFLAARKCQWNKVHGMTAEYPPNILFLNEFKASKQPKLKKDWEITAFRVKGGRDIIPVVDGNGFYEQHDKGYRTIQYFLNDPEVYEIYSVKRLSDNTEWTINEIANHYKPIKSFSIQEGELFAELHPTYVYDLNDLIKREPEQREWDIVSFRSKNNQKWVQIIDGTYVHERNPTASYSLKEMLEIGWSVKNGQLIIESVRRNSDGEVFCVGEKVNKFRTIKVFYIPKDYEARYGECTMAVCFEEPNANYCLSQLEKMPPKLFTTTDGVDIYPGMDFYVIAAENVSSFTAKEEDRGFWTKAKLFSTKEKAETNLYENKPIYSIKDFRELIQAFEERIATKTDNHV